MGSRKGGDYSKFAGGRRVARSIKAVQEAVVSNKPARIVVGTAVNVIAASQPTVATIMATYKVSKWIYRTYQKAANAKDANEGAKVVVRETAKYVVATVRDEAISNAVDVGWSTVKVAAGIKTSELQDRILRAATKSTLDEELPK